MWSKSKNAATARGKESLKQDNVSLSAREVRYVNVVSNYLHRAQNELSRGNKDDARRYSAILGCSLRVPMHRAQNELSHGPIEGACSDSAFLSCSLRVAMQLRYLPERTMMQ
eukprot:11228300-Lingulodinium_polyedra.AAC.2